MRALDRKLLRSLLLMKGQTLAIAFVIASGVATYIMFSSTLDSLYLTRGSYYSDYRFAEVFAVLKRAPEGLRERIAGIPGVDSVETRVVAPATIDIEGFPEPVTGRIVSLPDSGEPAQNRLHLRSGRVFEEGADDEIVISEAFSEAHGLVPGDTLRAVINGKRKTLAIVGTALSPEYIYQIAPGALLPDHKRYAIIWMAKTPLAAAYDMEGSFNSVTLTLSKGARPEGVIDALDVLLDRYGGRGAFERSDQFSHRFLSEELKQLQSMAKVFPLIFYGVAAFLLNVVITRLVGTEREQVAALKAFGYSNLDVGAHYLKLVVLITAIGVLLGIGLGARLGRGLSSIYSEFYRFPFLRYELKPGTMAVAALVSLASSVLGTIHAVMRAAGLPPAQAMRPEPPARYRETIIERAGLGSLLSQPTRMILRDLERRPVKSFLSVLGIAFASAILVVSGFQKDAIDYMVGVQFGLSQREDMAVTFVEPVPRKALHELKTLEGVNYVEGVRSVPVKLKFRHRSYRTSLTGLENGGDLYRPLTKDLTVLELPPEGVVLTDHLAKILGVSPGDTLTVEVLEDTRPVREVVVAGLVSQYLGVSAYMEVSALNRLMREGPVISGAYIAAHEVGLERLYSAVKEMPKVASTTIHKRAIESFYDTLAETILYFTFVATLLGGTIAFGVVYNSARITLSERNRELASLRVLGFTRGEVSYILIGELSLLTLLAIPVGFLVGRGLCAYLVTKLQTDLYRVPLVLDADTYAFAAVVVLASAFISALALKRNLDRLDLIGVLKTKE